MKRDSTATRRKCFDFHKWIHPVTGRTVLTCHICEGLIQPSLGEDWEAEHVIRRVLKKSDAPVDVWPAHPDCHKPKTARDISEHRKGERTSDKHFGIRRPKRSMRNSKYKKKISGEVVER